MKRIYVLLILPLLLIMISCKSDEEGPSEGLSSPTIENGENMTEVYYEDDELEKIIVDYAEKYRPQYHYSPKANWVNDPNGLVYYEGVWHLYYQYNPTGNTNNLNTHWGHATSIDLINWTEQEPALFPDDLGNMWSGTGVVDHNNTSGFFSDTKEKKGIVVAYSTSSQHIGIAYSTDGGYTYNKVSMDKPVLAKPIGVIDFRDPHIFWYEADQKWKMVVAGGVVRVYESPDLVHWSHCSDSNINTECPNLIKMKVVDTNEEKWLLSLGGRSYYVGSFNGKEFMKETGLIKMNEGPDAYAGITFSNAPNDRIVMISWLNNWAYTAQPDGVWNGCFTIPTELKLQKYANSYRLIQTPVHEVSSLRRRKLIDIKNTYYQDDEDPLTNIKSNCFELNLEVDLEYTNDFNINVCVGENEKTAINFKKDSLRFLISRCDSVYGIDAMKKQNFLYSVPIDRDSIKDNILKVRLFVDVSNLELYINDGDYYFVARIQPFSSSQQMSLVYENGIAINELTVFQMDSIWFEEGAKVTAPHIGTTQDAYIPIGEQIVRDVYPFTINTKASIRAKALDAKIVSVEVLDNKLYVKGLQKGETDIMVICGKYYLLFKCYVYDEGEGLFQSDLGELQVFNGQVSENLNHLLFQTYGGDAYALSNINCQNFVYATDVSIEGNGAAALLFRASDNLDSFYCMNLDLVAGGLKLWKKHKGNIMDVSFIPYEIELNKIYNLKIIAEGSNFKIYLDEKLINEINDDSLMVGRLGINVWNTNAKFNNLKVQTLDNN